MIIWSELRLPSQSDFPEDLYFAEDLDGSCGRDLDFKENTNYIQILIIQLFFISILFL